MTLSETEKIDIAFESPTGEVTLGIIVAEGWDDVAAKRDLLTHKLHTYLSYLHTAEYRDRFGTSEATLFVVTDGEPPPEILGLLRATEEAFGVPIRVQKVDLGGAAQVGATPRGVPKTVAVEYTGTGQEPRERRKVVPDAARLRRVRSMFALLGLALAVPAGVFTWSRSRSVALAIFVFVMVNYLVSRGVADVITDPQKVRRAFYFALTPLLSTAVLFLAWRQWHTMWLAVVLGFLGGILLNAILAPRLFPRVHREELIDSAERMKEAFARHHAAAEPER